MDRALETLLGISFGFLILAVGLVAFHQGHRLADGLTEQDTNAAQVRQIRIADCASRDGSYSDTDPAVCIGDNGRILVNYGKEK